MKRSLHRLGVALASLLLIAGCSSPPSEPSEVADLVHVVIISSPETIQLGQPVQIEAHVTQGSKPVEDAQEVEFEIWKEGNNKHEKIKVAHDRGGIYPISRTFSEEGVYYVIAHVTARDMHVMPKKELVVGAVKSK